MNFQDHDGIYRPLKIAPVTMEADKKSKQERDAERKTKNDLRRVRQNEYVRSLVDDLEGRPEEVSFRSIAWCGLLVYIGYFCAELAFFVFCHTTTGEREGWS